MSESAAVGSRGNAGRQRPVLRRESEVVRRSRRAGNKRLAVVPLRPMHVEPFDPIAAPLGEQRAASEPT